MEVVACAAPSPLIKQKKIPARLLCCKLGLTNGKIVLTSCGTAAVTPCYHDYYLDCGGIGRMPNNRRLREAHALYYHQPTHQPTPLGW
jgi:hypothetical protein